MLSVLGVNIAVLDVEPQSGGVQVAGLVPGTLHGERILRGSTAPGLRRLLARGILGHRLIPFLI